MNIRIKRVGITPEQFKKNVIFKFISVKNGMSVLGKTTRDYMVNVIKANKKRDDKTEGFKLEDEIKVYEKEGVNGKRVGIGLVSYLNVTTPWWFFLNYGISQKGMKIPGRGKSVGGFFGGGNRPDSSLAGYNNKSARESFTKQRNTYLMTPQNPIAPMHYIEKTINWVNTVWKVHFYNRTKETKVKTII